MQKLFLIKYTEAGQKKTAEFYARSAMLVEVKFWKNVDNFEKGHTKINQIIDLNINQKNMFDD